MPIVFNWTSMHQPKYILGSHHGADAPTFRITNPLLCPYFTLHMIMVCFFWWLYIWNAWIKFGVVIAYECNRYRMPYSAYNCFMTSPKEYKWATTYQYMNKAVKGHKTGAFYNEIHQSTLIILTRLLHTPSSYFVYIHYFQMESWCCISSKRRGQLQSKRVGIWTRDWQSIPGTMTSSIIQAGED